jgi:phosphoribosylformylglycinamidine cyclo-ligase
VNDIAVCGAKPLFFLDYLAFGKLNARIASDIIRGLVTACRENNCSLIGGETAEMPGLYDKNDFDLAGTIVGITEKKGIINKINVKKGDVLIGLESNGLHTNGYSLARNVLFKHYKIYDYIDVLGCNLHDELLRIHKSYLKVIQNLINRFDIHSISHITGGGIEGNTKRVIPKNRKLKLDWKSWKVLPIFELIKKCGSISDAEMRKVFNLGIGLVIIADKTHASGISAFLKKNKEKHYFIGEIY